FSSRRRHTRSKRDWSSDVCSSDLLTGDVAQCLINPFARLWIERRVFRKLQQPWHGRAPLLLAQHPGLSQPARRALADHRRRVVMKNIEQRRDGLISSQI